MEMPFKLCLSSKGPHSPRMAKTLPKKIFGLDSFKLLDLVIRVSLGVFFAFTAGIYYRNSLAALHPGGGIDLSPRAVVSALSILAGGLYTMMIASLYVLRYKPVNKFAGFWPSLAAVLGGFLLFGLVWFKPNAHIGMTAQIIASLLILISNILAAYILTRLGRSFSILPEGRKLVTKGPYKIVRHPLYMAEFFATIGTMIIYLSVGAVVLAVAQTLLQLVRIHYEEKVLTENFPEYKAYAKKTWRLVPGVY